MLALLNMSRTAWLSQAEVASGSEIVVIFSLYCTAEDITSSVDLLATA